MTTFGSLLPELTRLYRACEPNDAISPDDPRYVNLDDVRGINLPRAFERSLRRVDPGRWEVKVFAGHRGVGKTSELYRLRSMLENPKSPGEKPFQVIFADVSKSLDLNDLDFPDLLVFTAAEVQRQLREAAIPGFSATSQSLRNVWGDLLDTLQSRVTLDGVDVETPFASLALEIRNRPTARAALRSAIEQQSTNLLAAVNDLLQLATVQLRSADREGLVLIIDGLDKLVRRNLEDGSNTHDRLFIHRSEQLASLHAHVIYTVPISLIYSPQFTQLEQTFGEHNVPVPIVRLRGEKRSAPTPDTEGMSKMGEILAKRCESAGIDLGDVFDSPDTCHYLCKMTGGHPRHLMMFIHAAIDQVDTLPITRKAVDRAIRNYANSLLREIPDEFWDSLKKFDEPQESIAKDDAHQQMLFLLHVFEYMNGEPWYEVNPVLRTTSRFRK